jgi:hypothetical protein
MSSINEGNHCDHPDLKGRLQQLRHKAVNLLCVCVFVVTLGSTSGCSPSALLGGAIVGTVVYAHMSQGDLPNRREAERPHAYSPRLPVDPIGPSHMVALSSPPGQRTKLEPNRQPVSPVIQGALAYRELRWKDAARILSRAIGAGTCKDSELGQAHILLGAIAYQQGDAEVARTHFVETHRHDPQLQPSPHLFAPPLIEFYRATIPPPRGRPGRASADASYRVLPASKG